MFIKDQSLNAVSPVITDNIYVCICRNKDLITSFSPKSLLPASADEFIYPCNTYVKKFYMSRLKTTRQEKFENSFSKLKNSCTRKNATRIINC